MQALIRVSLAVLACAVRECRRIAELVMTVESHAAELPRLDAFDDEFGQDPVAILRAQRRKTRARIWTLIAVAIGAGIVGALALAWSTFGGRLRLEPQPAPMTLQSATREAPSEEVARLLRQVDALKNEVGGLKNEIRNLTQAQQQAAETIVALKAAQDAPSPVPSGHWYSNPAALTFGIVRQPEPGGVVLPPRRPATARPAFRKAQRRSDRRPRALEPSG
jgi:hypothetical protein